MAKSRASNKPISDNLIGIFCLLVALTPIISPYSQLIGNSVGVVTAHPWMSMASWLQVTMSGFIAYALYQQGRLQFNLTPVTLLVSLLLGWLFLSTFWAHNKFEAIQHIFYWVTALFGYFVVICWLRKKHWERLLTFIFISGVIAALVGILQHLFNFSTVIQAAPPASFFGNKNMGAHYALLTFPLGMTLFWVAKSPIRYWLLALGNALILTYVLYGSARAAWIASAITLVFISTSLLIILYKNNQLHLIKSRWQPAIASLLLVVALAHFNSDGFNPQALIGFTEEVSSINTQATDNFDQSNVRLIKWRNAWDLFADNWLVGIGLRNWLIEYPVYHQLHGFDSGVKLSSQSDHTHNDYIQLAVEAGTIGVLLFIILVFLVFSHLYRTFRNNSDGKDSILLIGVIGCLVGIGIDALFSFPLQLPHTLFLFLLYIGIIASTETTTIKEVRLLKAKPLAIGFGVFSILSILLYNQWFNAEVWYRKANFDIEANNYQAALVSAEKAYSYNPYKYDMLKYKAVAYKKLNHPEAEAAILAVLDGYPNNLNSLNRTVNYYITQKRPQDALPHALKMRDLAPRSGYVYQNLAAVYQAMGRSDKVIENIKKLLEVDPNNANAATYRLMLQ